ncbi:MAG: hypothetical protein QOI50_6419 [Pseudonocardiales bacterium]|jgi:uncharacterized SAM-binding protein YcdF (DUF218 family)|nr:hypothetical protein [Pseudonocardiales bacterium]
MRAPSPRATRSRPDVDGPAGLDPTGLARTVELTPVRPPRPRWLVRALVGSVLVAGLVVGGTAFRVWQVARVDDRRPVDVVVVLGAAQYDGSPSPIFAARLRHARELYDQGVAARIVTVGGRRAGDGFTEADAGRRYLVDRGVRSDAVVAIGEGSDTLESLRSVAATADQRGWHTALLVSDPWHSLRARTMARDSGLESWTSPTHSGPVVRTRETQVRYIVRETAALLFYRLTHASVETEGSGLG